MNNVEKTVWCSDSGVVCAFAIGVSLFVEVAARMKDVLIQLFSSTVLVIHF